MRLSHKIELLYRGRNLCNLLYEEVTDMIRLALVEDDALYRSQLREYIDKYSAASGDVYKRQA